MSLRECFCNNLKRYQDLRNQLQDGISYPYHRDAPEKEIHYDEIVNYLYRDFHNKAPTTYVVHLLRDTAGKDIRKTFAFG